MPAPPDFSTNLSHTLAEVTTREARVFAFTMKAYQRAK